MCPRPLPGSAPPVSDNFLVPQVSIDVVHLSRLNVKSEYVSILVAAQCLLLWLKIQYFARSAI